MHTGIVIFGLILLFLLGGLLAFYRNAKQPLPKNLPPPLPENDTEAEAD